MNIQPTVTHPFSKRIIAILAVLIIALTQVLPGQFQPTPVTLSNKRATIDGQRFLLHEVVRGQTLYGIAKAYQVPEEEIRKFNTGLNEKSVYPGQVLRIPDTGQIASTRTENRSGKFINHTVQPKETLFSLSRQYGVKVDDLRQANPDIGNGLKTGQIIRIPENLVTVEQGNPATVDLSRKAEVTDEPAIKRPEAGREPCTLQPFPHRTDTFHLAVLLPLNISQNDTLYFSDTLKSNYFRFYDFLEGLYLAADSLQKQGMNLVMSVFDTGRNADTLRNILKSDAVMNADLIIGPVFTNETEPVAAFAKSRHIPVMLPFTTAPVYQDNPFVFQVRCNPERIQEQAVSYLSSLKNVNMVVVGRLSDRSDPDFNGFRNNLTTRILEADPTHGKAPKTIYFSEFTRSFTNTDSVGTSITQALSRTRPNYLVLQSDNEVFITEAINKINQGLSDYDIHVFGLNPWAFTNIDLRSLYNVNAELVSDFEDEPYINFHDSLVVDFVRKYRDNWNIEPSKYSFQGFDTGYYFGNALFLFGRNLSASVPCWGTSLTQPVLMTPMRFQRTGDGSGYVNDDLSVIRYRKDDLILQRVN